MRTTFLCAAVALTASALSAGQSDRPNGVIALDIPQVRVFKSNGTTPIAIDPQPGVVVQVDDGHGGNAGTATWADDPNVAARAAMPARTVIVEPKRFVAKPLPSSNPGSQPGEATFTGMSFKTIFENERVAVIRARMEVGAREAFHTHASDTVVVHLTGGEIEDTADGVTKINRWKKGDVEFEERGSSHSARNVGGAIDVVLVTLKPQSIQR